MSLTVEKQKWFTRLWRNSCWHPWLRSKQWRRLCLFTVYKQRAQFLVTICYAVLWNKVSKHLSCICDSYFVNNESVSVAFTKLLWQYIYFYERIFFSICITSLFIKILVYNFNHVFTIKCTSNWCGMSYLCHFFNIWKTSSNLKKKLKKIFFCKFIIFFIFLH